jgi:penicillin-binding protein 1A
MASDKSDRRRPGGQVPGGRARGEASAFSEPHPGMASENDPLPSFIRREQEARGLEPLEDLVARKQAAPLSMDDPDKAPRTRAPLPGSLKRAFRSGARLARRDPGVPRSRPYRAARFVLYWGFIAAIWAAIMLVSAVTVYSLMAADPLEAGLDKQPAKVTIVSEDGKVVSEKGLRRSHVKLKDMPPHLIQAVLATEDRRFYYHYGFDPIGITRAIIRNQRAGRVVEGGSTVTQQLVKVLFLKPDRTYWRKIEEVLLALSLEYRFEKEQILELYLNRIYFGAGNYGVEAAAQHYFGKSVASLDVYECAMLAGLIRAPNFYAPTTDLQRSLDRGRVVLNAMRSYGDITLAEYNAALANPPSLRTYLPSQSYGFVIDWVVQQLSDLGLDPEADVTVQTTVNYELQAVAQRIVKDKMDQHGAELNAGEAAAVILDRTGAIKALVGGRDYTKNQFNRAVQAKRQPGSTFKPFVFLSALERGMSPDSLVRDGPLRIGTWVPANYNDRYYGDVTLRDALAKSMNTAAVRLSEWTGRDEVLKTAHRLGISSKLEQNASIALGTSEVSLLELASAYVPFANGGFSAMPHIITTVKDANGKEVYDVGRTNWGRVINSEHVAQMNDMLTATIQFGTGNQGSIEPHPAAGKTGTGQDYRDAWFIGYTAHYVTGVWLGNDDFKPMKRVTGGSLPTMIWRDLMIYAHLNKEPAYLPGGAQQVAEGRRAAPRRNNDSFWDSLFGGDGSSVTSDTTLGTPVAGTGKQQQEQRQRPKSKSWLEDLFSN